ncbi:MarR family transcriptional regulator [Flavobacterium sp. CYK-55]|uniref:MarR family winged helix-turn-helix transcriptional regulator n=1 Tax=Flavobacterium sp. CYK-55 TaxID=2835529 RepID=UPI001BCADF97|nr:MarR family transcriptional regulator [Flavobacterium sp. CYK-55]MBS7786128.1 MarR family transcriptional regulator [Flavobacterium sp. CYK-55]
MERLETINFYLLDKAIRTYRMYSQKKLKENGYKITVDQWLIIKVLMENPGISQQDIAEKVFKDNASVTRIIELLVKSKYLHRKVNPKDRRTSILTVTSEGEDIIEKVQNLVLQNRRVAQTGLTIEELESLNATLKKIIHNCQSTQ